MLKIIVPETELFDQRSSEFINFKSQTIMMEHSLVSISKWESKWKVPYLYNSQKTIDQKVDYMRCMTITQNVNPLIYRFLTKDIYEKIDSYINDPMTASKLPEEKPVGPAPMITSESIYYWMIILNIPVEFEKWHINRLLALIKYCEWKQREPKKMSKNELYARNRALNEERKRKYNTRG